MNSQMIKIISKLLNSKRPISRNRDFAKFSDPSGRQALRLYRLYTNLARDLDEASKRPDMKVEVLPGSNGVILRIYDPKMDSQRSCLVPLELMDHFQDALLRLGLDFAMEA